jgi:hypothetical protein
VGGGTLPNETPFKLYLNYRNNLYMLYKNLPAQQRRRILCIRFFMDALAAGVYGLRGKFSFFAAVRKAYFHFWKHRASLRAKRLPPSPHRISGIFRKSIVAGFYRSKKNRSFSKIEMVNGQR